MDLHIRNYVLYKARTLEQRKKELQALKNCYEEMKLDIIEETQNNFDGMPRGKGGKSDPVQNKVIRFEKLDQRIKTLERELAVFAKAEENIGTMDKLIQRIYKETIKNQSNLEYKAMEYGMCPQTLYNYRGKILRAIATDLGEYLDLDKIL